MPRINPAQTIPPERAEPTSGCRIRTCRACNENDPNRWNNSETSRMSERFRQNWTNRYSVPQERIQYTQPSQPENTATNYIPLILSEPDIAVLNAFEAFEEEPDEYDGPCNCGNIYDCDECSDRYDVAQREQEEQSRQEELREHEARFGQPRTYDGGNVISCNCIQCRDVHYRAERYETDARYNGQQVLSYSYKPRPVFFGDGPVFLGPEIEIAVPGYKQDKIARVANHHLGNLGYLKEDGSVDGFEMVTHPMSYSWAMDHFPWDMLGELSRLGCRPDSSCGIHVHVSKTGFSGDCHKYKWMKFVYRNSEPFQAIARRHDSNYARFHKSDHPERKHTKRIIKAPVGDYYIYDDRGYEIASLARYSAINVTNPHTYEVRAFASSLNDQEVKAAFGLVDATVEYTRTLSSSAILKESAWEWPSFAKWISSQNEKYMPLQNEMDKLCVY